jgi:hypothetical protein
LKINQRGQSALEYLMTYGWALVVIVVVVAALVLLVGNPAQAGDTCSGPGSGLNITNQNLTPTGWEMKISNITGRAIIFGSTSGDLNITGITGTTTSAYFPVPVTTVTSVAPGGVINVNSTGTPATTFGGGTRYRTDFTASYNDGDFKRTVTWSCSGTA